MTKIKQYWFVSFIVFFIIANLFVVFIKPIYIDPGLYWLYGQHLRWVYIDAPPLIALVTRIATGLLGNYPWVLNLLGLFSVLISARFLYLLVQSIYNETIARWGVLVWLLTPITVHYYIDFDWSYNNLLLCFWIISFYFFYQFKQTQKPIFIYGTAIVTALAVLTQFGSFFLILGLLLTTIIIKSYRQFYRNYHIYLALILFLSIIFPFLLALIDSNWLPIRMQYSLHMNNNHFALEKLVHNVLSVLNDLSFFFLIGLFFLIKEFKVIIKNETSLFLIIASAPILIFFTYSNLSNTQYFYPFYFGFVILLVPYAVSSCITLLKISCWLNFILFLVSILNSTFPQYGIGPGTKIFSYLKMRPIYQQLKEEISANDVLLMCTNKKGAAANMSNYSNIARIALYTNHVNTYATRQGYFVWQPKNIQDVLTQYRNSDVFYLCLRQPPPPVLGLICGKSIRLIDKTIYQPTKKQITDALYLKKCRVTL